MATTVSVGHKVNMAIAFFDQHGNPMLTTPAPDSPPTWSDTNPAAGTLVTDPTGLTAVDTAIAEGSDTVNLTVVVGGQSFSASLDITVTPEPQVLSSVQITSTVS